MNVSSNKAKGRTGQQAIQKLILDVFPELESDDVRSTSMGASGEDLLLSPAARKLVPYSIEVKRKKSIAACRFMEQAQSHGPHQPLCFFREDRGEWYACVKAKNLLELLRLVHILDEDDVLSSGSSNVLEHDEDELADPNNVEIRYELERK